MDYREEQFLRMQQSDTPKVPFYMSYPMQNLYLTEMEYEKDMDRMKELYPRDVSRIMDVIALVFFFPLQSLSEVRLICGRTLHGYSILSAGL